MLVSTQAGTAGTAHAFSELEETTARLHRSLAAGASSASHRSQVRASPWHRLGTPTDRKGTGQHSHRKEGETFLRGVSSKPNKMWVGFFFMFTYQPFSSVSVHLEHSIPVQNKAALVQETKRSNLDTNRDKRGSCPKPSSSC